MCSVRWGGVVTWLCLKLCFSVVKFHWFSELGPCLDPALVKAKLSTRFSSSNLQSSPAALLKISVYSCCLASIGVSIFHVFLSSLPWNLFSAYRPEDAPTTGCARAFFALLCGILDLVLLCMSATILHFPLLDIIVC